MQLDGEATDAMRTPGHYVSRIARGLARIGDARLRPLGFATAQLPVLTALGGGDRLSQRALVEWARVEQPTMAQLLARMERDGLVRREPDPQDRRSSLFSLTPAARDRLAAARAILRDGNAEATEGLAPAEVAQLLDLLRRVLANVERIEGRGGGAAD